MRAQSQLRINSSNWREFAAPAVNPSKWTAIIPAAGRGSRLGSDRPKILYPVAGRPIVEWLLDFLEPNCGRLVFVLSPAGVRDVRPELERLIPGRYDIVIQEVPRGMGDAVEVALAVVATPSAVIVWGDQVALRRQSVEACLRLHEGPLQPPVTCPTVLRPDPYIHFDRGVDGRINGLRQAREGDAMPKEGESDTGFFCFETPALRRLLAALHEQPSQAGHFTGEFNFLPVIPLAARQHLEVLTPALMTLAETVGINSAADVSAIEAFLKDKHAGTDQHID
jgi:bifunctional N-acetylglucosamine-1-phosphate-uridyltransferase/glucosamine-1-phosphate-acetyltransferase GlmU-like protein